MTLSSSAIDSILRREIEAQIVKQSAIGHLAGNISPVHETVPALSPKVLFLFLPSESLPFCA